MNQFVNAKFTVGGREIEVKDVLIKSVQPELDPFGATYQTEIVLQAMNYNPSALVYPPPVCKPDEHDWSRGGLKCVKCGMTAREHAIEHGVIHTRRNEKTRLNEVVKESLPTISELIDREPPQSWPNWMVDALWLTALGMLYVVKALGAW